MQQVSEVQDVCHGAVCLGAAQFVCEFLVPEVFFEVDVCDRGDSADHLFGELRRGWLAAHFRLELLRVRFEDLRELLDGECEVQAACRVCAESEVLPSLLSAVLRSSQLGESPLESEQVAHVRDRRQLVSVRCVSAAVEGPGRAAGVFGFSCEGEVCQELLVSVEQDGSCLHHRVEDEHLDAVSESRLVVEDAVETQQLVFLRLVDVDGCSFGEVFETDAAVLCGLPLAEQFEGVCDELVVQSSEDSCSFEEDAVWSAEVVDEEVFEVDSAVPRDASDAFVAGLELRQGVALFVQNRHDRLQLFGDFEAAGRAVSVGCLVSDEGEQRHALRRGLAEDGAGFVGGPGEELLGREQAPGGRVSAGFEQAEEVEAAVCLGLAAQVSQGVSELLLQVGLLSAGDDSHEVGREVPHPLVVLPELCLEAVCELQRPVRLRLVCGEVPEEVHGEEHRRLQRMADVQLFLHLFDDSEEFIDLGCGGLEAHRVSAQLAEQCLGGSDQSVQRAVGRLVGERLADEAVPLVWRVSDVLADHDEHSRQQTATVLVGQQSEDAETLDALVAEQVVVVFGSSEETVCREASRGQVSGEDHFLETRRQLRDERVELAAVSAERVVAVDQQLQATAGLGHGRLGVDRVQLEVARQLLDGRVDEGREEQPVDGSAERQPRGVDRFDARLDVHLDAVFFFGEAVEGGEQQGPEVCGVCGLEGETVAEVEFSVEARCDV